MSDLNRRAIECCIDGPHVNTDGQLQIWENIDSAEWSSIELDELGLDVIARGELKLALEDQFDCQLKNTFPEEVKTLGDVEAAVQNAERLGDVFKKEEDHVDS